MPIPALEFTECVVTTQPSGFSETWAERGYIRVLRSKTLISVLILVVIGLHLVPVLLDRGQRQITWPFLMWSMYKDSHSPGPIRGWKTRVVAVSAKGVVEPVTPRLVGLSGSTLGRLYLQPWTRGDSSAAERLIVRLNQGRQDPIVELRLSREMYTVSDTGLVRGDPPVLTYRLHPSKSR
jgi:hypothetical protein